MPRLNCWPLLLLLLTLTCAGITDSYALEPATGRLLLASNKINDSRFKETVILITGHEHGSMGIILNRPTGLKLAEVLPDVEEVRGRPTIFYFGGPVDKQQVLTLLRNGERQDNSSQVVGRTGLSDLKSVLDRFDDEQIDVKLRVYLGYVGWAPGQLNKEIARGDWLVIAEDEMAIYDPLPRTLWTRLWQKHTQEMTGQEKE